MYHEESDGLSSAACGEFDIKLSLLAAGELESPESEEMQKHIQSSKGCRTTFKQESKVIEHIASNLSESDSIFLGSCRAEVFDSLDQQEERSWLRRLTGSF